MARNRNQRRQQHGSAWHWKQTNCWYYTPPGTRTRVSLLDEKGERIRGKESKEAAQLALARVKLAEELAPVSSAVSKEWTVAQVCEVYLADLTNAATPAWMPVESLQRRPTLLRSQEEPEAPRRSRDVYLSTHVRQANPVRRGPRAADPGHAQPGSFREGPSAMDLSRHPTRGFGKADISQLMPDPDQPRSDFDEESLAMLSADIRRRGQLHPIHVRWSEELQKWVIITGERRWRASQQAGLTWVDCFFHDAPLTRAEVLKLPSDIQQQVEDGQVPARTAYELSKLNETPNADAWPNRRPTVNSRRLRRRPPHELARHESPIRN